MAGLPGVSITINNDQLGQTNQTADTIAGLIATGVTVAGAGNVTVNLPYQLFSLEDAEAIGITAGGTNAYAHSQIKDFYDGAGKGAGLWIIRLPWPICWTQPRIMPPYCWMLPREESAICPLPENPQRALSLPMVLMRM